MKQNITSKWLGEQITLIVAEDVEITLDERVWGHWSEGYGYVEFYRGGEHSFAVYFLDGVPHMREGNEKVVLDSIEDLKRVVTKQIMEWNQI